MQINKGACAIDLRSRFCRGAASNGVERDSGPLGELVGGEGDVCRRDFGIGRKLGQPRFPADNLLHHAAKKAGLSVLRSRFR